MYDFANINAYEALVRLSIDCSNCSPNLKHTILHVNMYLDARVYDSVDIS